MKTFKKYIVTTKEQARQEAKDWQVWQSTQNLSYQEMSDWQEYFVSLAKKYHLIREFKENGII